VSQRLDKAAFLADKQFETHTHKLGDFGTIEIRSLSRAEMMDLRKQFDGPEEEIDVRRAEQYLVATAAVDPEFDPDEVAEWQAGPHGHLLDGLVDRINEVSGFGGEAGKEATVRFPD
jgi:hypothetical protein